MGRSSAGDEFHAACRESPFAVIAPLRGEHAEEVAALHCATLTGLLSRLGPGAAKAFYTGCARTNLAIGMVYREASVVRGVVLGSLHPDRLQREVFRKNPVATLASVGKGIVMRPTSLVWLLKSFGGPDEGSFDASAPSLVYLSVAADRRGGGVGRQLVDAFSESMRTAEADGYDLSVDEDNAPAIAFYERLGFRLVGQYREFRVQHRRYRLALR
jgi:GNAT superfamily N-acetyltransferase